MTEYLNPSELHQLTGFARPTSQAHWLVAKGAFPGPRQLSAKRVGWLVREVEEWEEARPRSALLPVANCGGNA